MTLIPGPLRTAVVDLHRDEAGQAMTEYVILLVAIAIAAIGLTQALGQTVNGKLEVATSALDEITPL